MIFNVNLDRDYRERKKAFLISLFVPGLGQLISGRIYGIFYMLVNIALFAFILFLRKPEILRNGLILAGFIVFHIFNIADAFAGPFRKSAPCSEGCPAGIDIPGFISLIADRRFEEAKGIILRDMPFISVCGTICPSYCEDKCVRGGYDSPVMIMRLKKSVDDYSASVKRHEMPVSPKRAAIIGAGPAGLSAAYFLSKAGIQSTIFERESEPGGLLRYGIPEYRMDMLDLLKDTEAIISDENIKLVTGKAVGTDYPIAGLLDDYAYVIIATGNQKANNPFRDRIPERRVKSALRVLRDISKNEYVKPGNEIVIIGGGNAAFDAARSVLRLGAEPVIIYRRSENEMPASAQELAQAREEGIEIIFNTVIESIAEEERVKVTVRNSEGLVSVFTADCIIYATGQTLDLSVFDTHIIRKGMYTTNYSKLFIVPDGGSVVHTVANARRVSEMLIRKEWGLRGLLHNMHSRMRYNIALRDVPDAAWNYGRPRRNERINLYNLENGSRANSFFKIERDLTREEAVAQAKRCLGCHRKNGLSFRKEEEQNSLKQPDEGML